MKIKEMTAKTSLEIQATDVFLIEDTEDTKQVSMEELVEYLFAGNVAKEIIATAVNGILDSEFVTYAIEQDK